MLRTLPTRRGLPLTATPAGDGPLSATAPHTIVTNGLY